MTNRLFSNPQSRKRILALLTFLSALALYLATLAPTTSFWDSGEFIAVAHGLQVGHPPGAPFYALTGRLFSMFMPASQVAASINVISALTSALTVMLLYLVIVRLVQEFRNTSGELPGAIAIHGGALLGALTFAVSDTFWYNAVEAEVYAPSLFITALVVWAALKWSEHHKKQHSDRWLVLVAYLFGLALGVHLLNLLALFFVALIIYFKKTEEVTLKSFAVMAALAAGAFLAIYPLTLLELPGLADSFGRITYGLLGPISFVVMVAALLGAGIYYTHRRKMRLANLALLGFAMILIGYSSYALIFIRSTPDPPIDLNDPETTEAFISYLEREQYGNTPLLKGHTFDNARGEINRQEEVLFPRRYSAYPDHLQAYTDYASDLDYFLNYQMGHMYLRYFNWNFIGRQSDIQDAGWQGGFAASDHPDNPGHNSYFYLPLLLGLAGMLFHFRRDPRRAFSVLVLFVMTGLAIAVYLNQTPMEPRERDYAYVGSFFAFAIWIGMGGVAAISLVRERLAGRTAAGYAALAALLLAVPLWMGYQNYDDHDRSGRYLAADYAYNLLQSTAPNAILFTGGDNDTYPLWYLQEVEGVRTDVRVVNLSLLNTDWYIRQLRDQPAHEADPLPITLNDQEIDRITSNYALHRPDTLTVPAGPGGETISWYFEGRPAGTDGQGNPRRYTMARDEVILDILRNKRGERPVYFATSVGPSDRMGLEPFFRLEGKAFRLVPERRESDSVGWVDPDILAERLGSFRFRQWDNPDVYFNEINRGMMVNYRMALTRLAEAWLERGEDEKARKWLAWGEERIPFRFGEEKRLSTANYLVRYTLDYARAGEQDSALRLNGKAEEGLTDELQDSVENFDRVARRIRELNEQAGQARMNANPERQRQINRRIQSLAGDREAYARNVNMAVYYLTAVQRVYFMAGEEEQARELASRVNGITGERIGLPSSEAENRQRFNTYGF